MRTIALEEHFVTAASAHHGASTESLADPGFWRHVSSHLLDHTEQRLSGMDDAGIDLAVLSLNAPGIQAEPDPAVAVRAAIEVNDFLAGLVAEHPTRFAGFAALPLQDPHAAAKELDRVVTQLGMPGALINAHTQGRYLDDASLRVVWERAEGLNVPLYLHPANGYDIPHVLSGHRELLGPLWSWGIETATHALRVIFGGVFDDFPNARLILGHLGEGLPYALWRMDSRWRHYDQSKIRLGRANPSDYLRHNVYITTSGVFSVPPLLCALLALGAERILFATDYPFEEMAVATQFLDDAPISEADRARIAHRNAESLLNIPAPAPTPASGPA
ncbi:amidohydrolase family protein [Pseudonocardia eucalypti]|uniref:Amidohydrolase family protein n=1 Tax=Pseudonocardia eucalypti TaxID=648755 RepID=A0ABP9QJG4_9PSEU|nr:2,3-dihydroxybenzoate decarboxylase [Pseudonocardia eucalypti]